MFYSHLIDITEVLVELDSLGLTEGEKHHLAQLIDSNLHSSIMDTILSELSEEDKHIFLNHLKKEDHEKIWELLNTKVDRIEEKIKQASEELKKEIKKDVKKAKRIK